MRHDAGHLEEGGGGRPVPHSDGDLVLRLRSGEVAAFGRLVARYQGLVHSIARARLRQREAAEDLTQEVFLKAYLCLDQLADPNRFGAWVAALARNLALDWFRRGVARSKFLQMVPIDEGADEVADPKQDQLAEAASERMDRELVDQVLWSMPPDLREVILLHYEEELSQAEISRHLGIHASTVGRRLEQALGILRRGVVQDMAKRAASQGVRARIDGEAAEAAIARNLKTLTRADQAESRLSSSQVAARAMALAVAVAALPDTGRAAVLEAARETVRQVGGQAALQPAQTGLFVSVAKWAGIATEGATTGTIVAKGSAVVGSLLTVGVAAMALLISPADPMALFGILTQPGAPFGAQFSMPTIPPPVNASVPIIKPGDKGEFFLPVGRSFSIKAVEPMNEVQEFVFFQYESNFSTFMVGFRDKSGNVNQIMGGFSMMGKNGQPETVEFAEPLVGGYSALGPDALPPVATSAIRSAGPAPSSGATKRLVPVVVDSIFGLFLLVEPRPDGCYVQWTYRYDPKMLKLGNDLRQAYVEGRMSIMDMRNQVLSAARSHGYFDGFPAEYRPMLEWSYRLRLGEQAPAPNVEPYFTSSEGTSVSMVHQYQGVNS